MNTYKQSAKNDMEKCVAPGCIEGQKFNRIDENDCTKKRLL